MDCTEPKGYICYYFEVSKFQVDIILIEFTFSFNCYIFATFLLLRHNKKFEWTGQSDLFWSTIRNSRSIRVYIPVSYTHLTLPTICSV